MDLKQVRQLLTLAETLNFRRAAEQLNMAQPPLSVSIRKLEEEIGVALFDRSRAGVQLTIAGKGVLEHARRTLFHAEQIRQTAQLGAHGQIGTLRISFVPSSTIRLLPRSIAHFRARHPRVDLRLSEAGTNSATAAVKDGTIDIGLVRYPTPNHPAVETVLVETNYYMVALPASHPMADHSSIAVSDLRDEPFIMPSPLEGSASYMSMMHVCASAGFVPNIVQEASQAQTILALVEAGLGIALVPNAWEHLAPRAIRFHKLRGMPKMKIGLALVYRREERDSVLLRAFRQSVEAAVKAR